MDEDPHDREWPAPPAGADRTWPVLAHLSAFLGLAVAFGGLLGPLAVWLSRRDTDPETEHHARESLNFQISMTIWIAISCVLMLVFVGFVMFAFFYLVDVVLTIVAAVKASNGERWRYPLTWRFVRPPSRATASMPESRAEPRDADGDDYRRDERAR